MKLWDFFQLPMGYWTNNTLQIDCESYVFLGVCQSKEVDILKFTWTGAMYVY